MLGARTGQVHMNCHSHNLTLHTMLSDGVATVRQTRRRGVEYSINTAYTRSERNQPKAPLCDDS